jgi:hypothetical protein
MSFYDDASIVIVPSGYKTSKIYAEKPTDGSGDLTFARAATATRVGPTGLVEEVRTNLLTHSEDFTNASWTKTATTATANNTTAPDGTTTADRILETATTAQHLFTSLLSVSAGTHTFSIYLKANGRNFCTVYPQGTGMAAYATIDLSNGTINSTGGAQFVRATISSAGSGWYRVSVALTTTANPLSCSVYLSNALGVISPSYLGVITNGIFVWGAQLEVGDISTNYIATNGASASTGPVSNLPRLDYLGSSCPLLLLEGQRTNLALYSEQFDNSYWTKLNATVTGNSGTSPDGYTNADKLIDNATNAGHTATATTITVVNATAYTFSVFAKAAELSWIRLEVFSGGCYFNLSNGTLGTASGATAAITSYGNGWYRCEITATSASTSATPAIRLTTGDGVLTYSGTSKGVFLWGAQLEAGGFISSYIPTIAATATRVAETASKTGISSLIGQTEGTLFVEFSVPANEAVTRAIVLSNATISNRVVISVTGALVAAVVDVAGVNQVNSTAAITPTNMNKVALRYKANDFALYLNGTKVITDTSGSTFSGSTLDRFAFAQPDSTSPFSGKVTQVLVSKTAFTDAQLAQLTTL